MRMRAVWESSGIFHPFDVFFDLFSNRQPHIQYDKVTEYIKRLGFESFLRE